MKRPLYMLLGTASLGLGIAGTMLPLLPTTPFLLASAWLFSRSSPRLEAWLHNHKVFGATLRNWERSGSIAPRTKIIAVVTMVLSYGLTWFLASPGPVLAIFLAATLLACGTFVVTRPNPD